MRDRVLNYPIRHNGDCSYHMELRELLLSIGWYLCEAEADLYNLPEKINHLRQAKKSILRFERKLI